MILKIIMLLSSICPIILKIKNIIGMEIIKTKIHLMNTERK